MLNTAKLVITACVLMTSVGCSALPVTFNVTTQADTTIPKGTVVEQLVGTLGFGQFASLDLSQSQEFKNNDVQKRHVANASIKSLGLKITAPDEQTFDFLESISFYIEAPGEPKKRIAHKAIPKGSKQFECDIDALDLGPYVRADSMSITTQVKGRRPDADTTVNAKLTISVSTVLVRL